VETPVVSHRYTRAGRFTASLAVKDNKDAYSESQAKIEIVVVDTVSNEPPVIRDIVVTPDPVISGRAAVITIDAVDPNDDIVEYAYSIETGVITGSGSTILWQAPKIPGDYRLDITVKDSSGNYDSTDYYITVRDLPLEQKTNLAISAVINNVDILADGTTPAYINAMISWQDPETKETSNIQGRDIREFTADLSEFDGRSSADLKDNGEQGDMAAGDGDYWIKFTPGTHMSSGIYEIRVSAELADGREITTSIAVNVESVKEDQDRTPLERLESPGFGIDIALVGLLIACVLLLKKRET
jgi:hypothetical protein